MCLSKFHQIVVFVSRTEPSPYIATMFADCISGLITGHDIDFQQWISTKCLYHMSCLQEGPIYLAQIFDDGLQWVRIGLHKPPFQLWGLEQTLLICSKCRSATWVKFEDKRNGFSQATCVECGSKSGWIRPPEELAYPVHSDNSDLFRVALPLTPHHLSIFSELLVGRANNPRQERPVLRKDLLPVLEQKQKENQDKPPKFSDCCMFCGSERGLIICGVCRRPFCTLRRHANNSKVGCVDFPATAPGIICPPCFTQAGLPTPVSTCKTWS